MTYYNFTEGMRRVLAHAREEAALWHHEYVGTEHLLLGIIRRGEGAAIAILDALHVSPEGLRTKLGETLRRGKSAQTIGPDLPYTSRAKLVLELAMKEAHERGHHYVGSEHLLLGLLREQKGIAAQVLADAGVTAAAARQAMAQALGDDPNARHVAPSPEPPAAGATRRQQQVKGYNFTDEVRGVLAAAREASARLHHPYVGTEHLLLGVLMRVDSAAMTVLRQLGVDADAVRGRIETIAIAGDPARSTSADLPYTNRARRALELAMAEAHELAHGQVGSGHLLLGIILEEQGIGAQVLAEAGVTEDAARKAMLANLEESFESQGALLPHFRMPARATATLVVVEVRYEGGWMQRREFRTVAEAMAYLADR